MYLVVGSNSAEYLGPHQPGRVPVDTGEVEIREMSVGTYKRPVFGPPLPDPGRLLFV